MIELRCSISSGEQDVVTVRLCAAKHRIRRIGDRDRVETVFARREQQVAPDSESLKRLDREFRHEFGVRGPRDLIDLQSFPSADKEMGAPDQNSLDIVFDGKSKKFKSACFSFWLIDVKKDKDFFNGKLGATFPSSMVVYFGNSTVNRSLRAVMKALNTKADPKLVVVPGEAKVAVPPPAP